jgi:hypothetical protein
MPEGRYDDYVSIEGFGFAAKRAKLVYTFK